MKYQTICFCITFLLVGATNMAVAEESLGQQEYEASCAVCHGVDGKGGGAFTEYLKSGIPSLTTLAKNNGGVFPVDRVYSVIDGRTAKGHGTREMPIWGAAYTAESIKARGPFFGEWYGEEIARGRILALISYISTLQE